MLPVAMITIHILLRRANERRRKHCRQIRHHEDPVIRLTESTRGTVCCTIIRQRIRCWVWWGGSSIVSVHLWNYTCAKDQAAPEDSSEGEEVALPEESDIDSDHEESSSRQTTSEQTGSGSTPSPPPQISVSYPVTDTEPERAPNSQMYNAKAVAATRGLQINVGGKQMNRASGLPASPRPVRYPGSPGIGSSGNHI